MRKRLSCLLALLVMITGTCVVPDAVSAAQVLADELPLNCMTIVVGKDVSATGRVMVGHNEDDIGRCVVRHGYVEAAEWPEGTVLPAETGRAAIPQVESTFGYYWSQVRDANRGFSGADIFLNENGVCIVSNNNAESKENILDESRLTDGGIEYNVRRIVAERATSARDALNIIIELVEEWGYAPSGRAYTVADSEEAFMIQIASGRRYIAARIPDDMVVAIPNHYTFHGINDVEEMYYSEDLISHAIEMNWYKPAVEGDYSDFDFALAYQDSDSYGTPYNVLRQKYAMEILLDQSWDVDTMGLPYAFKPESTISLEDMIEVLSTHYEGTEHEDSFGPGASPHDTSTRKICTGSTIEATIFDLAETPVLTTAWTAFGRPCQLPFLPLHPLAGTVDEIDQMENPAKEMEEHLTYRDQATVYSQNGWQTMRDFENLHEMLYSEEIEKLTELKNTLHETYTTDNAELISQAEALMDDGKEQEALDAIAQADRETVSSTLAALEKHADEEFRLVEISEVLPFSLSMPPIPYTVTFACDAKPVESELLFGMGFTNVRLKYAPALADTLKDFGNGLYSVDFDPFIMMDSAAYPGEFEFILGGKTEDGQAFAGMAVIPFTE
ncbi:hypothetical protein D7Y05_07335 [bacterium 1XD42-54]|nr:hypothetical protein D7Y05_07335 [bacterium 1XD42-54]